MFLSKLLCGNCLLTMQPFNSIITFHSLWGAVSTTIQLYFSFLAGLICFLIHKQLILKRVKLPISTAAMKGHCMYTDICESLSDNLSLLQMQNPFFTIHPSGSPSALLFLFNCTFFSLLCSMCRPTCSSFH